MHPENFKVEDLSLHLFWDTDISTIDLDSHFQFIIKRVLDYGLLEDWKKTYRYFGLQKITEAAKKIRDLDPKSMNMIVLLSGSKPEEFACYTTNQSTPKPWNF